jgi:2-keto-3-deoxy-6-phosphogluconate aldolase
MMSVGQLGSLNILPSGGIGPEDVSKWIDAGACAVGMGSNLVGRDIRMSSDDPNFAAAAQAWETTGKAAANKLFTQHK